MKRKINLAFVILECIGIGFMTVYAIHITAKATNFDTQIERLMIENDSLRSIHPDTVFIETKSELDWFITKLALIKVESGFNPNAVNKSSFAGGLFQIMPQNGFLQESNRIVGYDKYTDDSRFDVIESVQIFEIVNKHHNKMKSIEQAIQLHNPTAGEWYKERVLTEYAFFKSISYQL